MFQFIKDLVNMFNPSHYQEVAYGKRRVISTIMFFFLLVLLVSFFPRQEGKSPLDAMLAVTKFANPQDNLLGFIPDHLSVTFEPSETPRILFEPQSAFPMYVPLPEEWVSHQTLWGFLGAGLKLRVKTSKLAPPRILAVGPRLPADVISPEDAEILCGRHKSFLVIMEQAAIACSVASMYKEHIDPKDYHPYKSAPYVFPYSLDYFPPPLTITKDGIGSFVQHKIADHAISNKVLRGAIVSTVVMKGVSASMNFIYAITTLGLVWWISSWIYKVLNFCMWMCMRGRWLQLGTVFQLSTYALGFYLPFYFYGYGVLFGGFALLPATLVVLTWSLPQHGRRPRSASTNPTTIVTPRSITPRSGRSDGSSSSRPTTPRGGEDKQTSQGQQPLEMREAEND